MRLLNKSGKLLITHSIGGDFIQKVLKIAFKDKEAFPNKAKDIIEHFNVNYLTNLLVIREVVKGMKKNKADFEDRYGEDAESVMYATATKIAKEKA